MAALAAGLAATGAAGSPPPVEAAALVAALALTALAAIRLPALGPVVAGLLLAGMAVGGARIAAIDAPGAAVDQGLPIDARATLLERPHASAFGEQAEVEILDGEAAGAVLLARTSGELRLPDADPGADLEVTGYAAPPDASTGADFDWPAYLAREGIAGELELETVRTTGDDRGGVAGALDDMRRRAEEALTAGASPEGAALIRGMVLGQDEAIDELVHDDFRAAGLAHLLAVSGQNVMLLALLALPALGALELGPRGRALALLSLIALYVPLAGAGPSLQRAGVMGAAGVVALSLGRPASRWYGLLLAANGTLALNPRVVGDAGWQLSFAALLGILLIGPGIRRALGGVPRVAGDAIALTASATLATAPLLAHHFGAVSLVSLPANLVALPAVAPAMWIGMVQIAVGQVTALGEPVASVAMAVVEALGDVNGVLLTFLAGVASRFAEVRGAELGVSLESPVGLVGAYVTLAVAVIGARRAARRAEPRAAALASRWRTAARRRRIAAALVLILLLAAAASELTGPGEPPGRLTVSFLDVGQGDATLVQHPDGGAVLFDAGPAEARVARLLSEAGVSRLSAVVATHASADHHGGLAEVLQRFPVELLLDGGDRTDDPEFRAMLGEAESQGVRTVPAVAGQRVALGGIEVEVLSPPPRPPGPAPEDPNPRAVVAVVRSGAFDLLLSADAESPTLTPLDLPDVEAMKVPHHGSADEGLPAVLEEARPEIAAIEVGDNSYGHPHPATLEALEESGAHVYRTDHHGTVELTVDGGALAVTTER